jgi:hypothetical protein
MVTFTGYADADGYIGDIYFETYRDRKRYGLLPEQQQTVFDNDNNTTTKYYTAATTTPIPCTKQRSKMPEDMKREYGRLPSSYNNNIGNLAAESVQAAMNRLRQKQRFRVASKAQLDEETGMSQLERELAIINWEV